MLVRDLPSTSQKNGKGGDAADGAGTAGLMVNNGGKKDDAGKDGKKGSGEGSGVFWTKEKSNCVYQMAKFLRTLIIVRNIAAHPVGSSSRLRSSFFQSSGANKNSGNKEGRGDYGGNSILDIVAAKDVITTLYESLPVPVVNVKATTANGSETPPPTGESTQSSLPAAAAETTHTVQVWTELESLLNCLIPSTAEVEMIDGAAEAARDASSKVIGDIRTRPPSSKSSSKIGTGASDVANANAGSTKSSGKNTPTSTNTDSNTVSTATSQSSPTPKASGCTKTKRSSQANANAAEKNRNTDPLQFLKQPINCTCNHGLASHCIRTQTNRAPPVHPMHSNSGIRQLNHSTPPDLEMIHTSNGNYDTTSESDERYGKVPPEALLVYQNGTAAGLGVDSRETMKFPYEISDADNVGQYKHSLSFDSCFETGNLYQAVQVGAEEYDLFTRPDLHSAVGHMQWFYFSISNTHNPANSNAVQRVKFNIMNMQKNDSLFNQGMRPVMYSTMDAANPTNPKGWVRCGVPGSIRYFSNSYKRIDAVQGQPGMTREVDGAMYFTLTMTIDFHNPNDTYLLAYTYPYTYTDMKYHIQDLLSSPRTARHMRRQIMCKTVAGHDCELLTIADFAATENKDTGGWGVEEQHLKTQGQGKRKCVVLSARVHPGEVGASWMMKGILDFLTSESEQAALLRSIFVFKIVPMLNPDGVIFGNNRCAYSGVDLNRTWKRPVRAEHPTIWHWKNTIRDLKGPYEVTMFVDLHGHSRKMNSFMYGCDDKRKPKPTVRVFPKLLSWNQFGRKYVSFADCCFSVKKGREGTGRVVVSKELGIQNAYTLEATFCGADFGPLKDVHFNTGHLCEGGRALIDTLLDYYMPNPQQREKAANLLRQASEKKAARDRSERMAAARTAMAQIRSDQNSLLATYEDLEEAGVTVERGSLKNDRPATNSNKAAANDRPVQSAQQRLYADDSDMVDSLETAVLSEKSGGLRTSGQSSQAKVNTFMIDSDKQRSRGGGAASSRGGGGNSSRDGVRRQGSAGDVLRSSEDVGARTTNMRPFGNFEKERDNTSAKRGGVSVMNNGFMGGGGSSSSTSLGGPKGSYFSTTGKKEPNALASLPAGPSFLLSTLTRDAQAIRDERAGRGTSTPSPGPPAGLMGPSTGLPSSANSMVSPADRNRTVRATGSQGEVVVGRANRIRSVGGGTSGGAGGSGGGDGRGREREGFGGMDTLLPRVGGGAGGIGGAAHGGASSLRGSSALSFSKLNRSTQEL
jgi:hypothetical protein